jgi:hypothetical protein
MKNFKLAFMVIAGLSVNMIQAEASFATNLLNGISHPTNIDRIYKEQGQNKKEAKAAEALAIENAKFHNKYLVNPLISAKNFVFDNCAKASDYTMNNKVLVGSGVVVVIAAVVATMCACQEDSDDDTEVENN